jgi:hypothetical protein
LEKNWTTCGKGFYCTLQVFWDGFLGTYVVGLACLGEVGRSPVNGGWEHIAEVERMLEGAGRWLEGNWTPVACSRDKLLTVELGKTLTWLTGTPGVSLGGNVQDERCRVWRRDRTDVVIPGLTSSPAGQPATRRIPRRARVPGPHTSEGGKQLAKHQFPAVPLLRDTLPATSASASASGRTP